LRASVVKRQIGKAAVPEHTAKEKKRKKSRTIIRLFLSKKKSTGIVSQAYKSKLAYLISVVTSYKRAYRRGLRNKPLDVNIRKQQTISQLIISN
jgi:hypothetical protein